MTQPISQSITRNNQMRCKAPGCTKPRYNLSAHCRAHFKNAYLYGDPLGRSIPRKEYMREYEEATELIIANLTHPATETATRFIQKWLDDSSSGQARVAATEMNRLVMGGVTAVQVLIEATAMYLYSQRRPKTLPDDERLSYQMANAVFRLSPQASYVSREGKRAYKRASGASRRATGKRLRDSLGLYFVNAYSAIRRKEEVEQEMRERLWTPLHIQAKTNP
jgi:hypothetical protein